MRSPCPLCGATRKKFVGVRKGRRDFRETRIVRCSFCSLIRADPMPRLSADEIARMYSDISYFPKSVEDKERLTSHIFSSLARRGIVSGKLLDVGCGRGDLVAFARSRGFDAEGFDPSPVFVEHARRKYGLPIKVATWASARVPRGAFDVVVLSHVLEHVENPRELVRRCAQWLKPGGTLVCQMPNEAGIFFVLTDALLYPFGRTIHISPTFVPFHLLGFDKWTLSLAGISEGLLPVFFKTFSGQEYRHEKNFFVRLYWRLVGGLGGLFRMHNLMEMHFVKPQRRMDP